MSVWKPDGSKLDEAPCGENCLFDQTLPVSGKYKVQFAPSGSKIGSISAKLHDATDVLGALVFGDPSVRLTTSVPGQDALWTFNGAAGQKVKLEFAGSTFTSSDDAYVWVWKPDGVKFLEGACGTNCVFSGVDLPDSGTYKVQFRPSASKVGSVSAQLFDEDSSPLLDDGVTRVLGSEKSGLCLNLAAAALDNGAKLQQANCVDVASQGWNFTAAAAPGYYIIVNKDAEKCIDVPASATESGIQLQQFDCNGTGAQAWRVASAGSGFKIRNKGNGLCLAAKDGSETDSTPIVQIVCGEDRAQDWNIMIRKGVSIASFDNGTEGWSGHNLLGGNSPWSVGEWRSLGAASLKTDFDLAGGESFLYSAANRDLSGRIKLTATVRVASWPSKESAERTIVKLYIKTGPTWEWKASEVVLATSEIKGGELSLDLTNVTNLQDVREIGIAFVGGPGTTGGSAFYVDDVRVQ